MSLLYVLAFFYFAALRDLGLKVHLKEEWKGEPINIKSDFVPTWD